MMPESDCAPGTGMLANPMTYRPSAGLLVDRQTILGVLLAHSMGTTCQGDLIKAAIVRRIERVTVPTGWQTMRLDASAPGAGTAR